MYDEKHDVLVQCWQDGQKDVKYWTEKVEEVDELKLNEMYKERWKYHVNKPTKKVHSLKSPLKKYAN